MESANYANCSIINSYYIKKNFFEYIQDNFSLDSTSEKLVKNILNFVEMNYPEEKEQYNVLRYFLNDIPGLTDAEIRKVYL